MNRPVQDVICTSNCMSKHNAIYCRYKGSKLSTGWSWICIIHSWKKLSSSSVQIFMSLL